MSVQTEADKHLDVAKENVNNAVISLSKIVVEKCDGHDQYNQNFEEKMKGEGK